MPAQIRAGHPELVVEGNPNGLKIDKLYHLKIREKKWVGPNEIISIKPVD